MLAISLRAVPEGLAMGFAFAAGAMVFVVVEELIPASQRQGDTDVATASTLLGFVVMMGLDAGLGGEAAAAGRRGREARGGCGWALRRRRSGS